MVNTKSIVAIYWFVLFSATMFIYEPRIGWFDSFYFFGVTVTTVGFGDITPQSIQEKVIALLVAFSATISYMTVAIMILLFVQEKINKLFKRRYKMINKPSGNIEIMIIGSNYEKIQTMMRVLKKTGKPINVICDGTNEQFIKIRKLKALFSTLRVWHQENIYDPDFVKDIESIETLCICSSNGQGQVQSNHRMLALVNFFEAKFMPRSIAEAKGEPEMMEYFSLGDITVPVTNGTLLALEIVKEGAFDREKKIINELTEGITNG